jgi:hypothetical protein
LPQTEKDQIREWRIAADYPGLRNVAENGPEGPFCCRSIC